MRLILLCLISSSLIFLSCGGKSQTPSQVLTQKVDKEQLSKEIDAITNELKEASTAPIDVEKGQLLIDKTKIYVNTFPKEPVSANYLFLSGEVSRGIGKFDQAIEIFRKVHMNYPRSKRAPPALFLQAFTYENDLKDIKKAKKLYNDFLYKFAGDPLEEQIKQILTVIDKSPEELIKEFKAKQK